MVQVIERHDAPLLLQLVHHSATAPAIISAYGCLHSHEWLSVCGVYHQYPNEIVDYRPTIS